MIDKKGVGYVVEFRVPSDKINKILVDEDIAHGAVKRGQEAIDEGSVVFVGDVPREWIDAIYDKNGKKIFENSNKISGKTSKQLYHYTVSD